MLYFLLLLQLDSIQLCTTYSILDCYRPMEIEGPFCSLQMDLGTIYSIPQEQFVLDTLLSPRNAYMQAFILSILLNNMYNVKSCMHEQIIMDQFNLARCRWT